MSGKKSADLLKQNWQSSYDKVTILFLNLFAFLRENSKLKLWSCIYARRTTIIKTTDSLPQNKLIKVARYAMETFFKELIYCSRNKFFYDLTDANRNEQWIMFSDCLLLTHSSAGHHRDLEGFSRMFHKFSSDHHRGYF